MALYKPGWPEKGPWKDERRKQKSRCFQRPLWSVEGTKGGAVAPDCLAFFHRLRDDCRKRFGLRRCGDDFRNALAGFERAGAVEVGALVIALLHLLRHIAT